MKPFAHLHVHTEFSLLDGAARMKKLIKTCKEYGMPAIAITDHGNMYGAVKFYNLCKENDIKPIIGCEFYICENIKERNPKSKYNHLILLAKNEEGYKNLCKLNSIAFVDGYYYKPRIDYKILQEHASGLVCLSACLLGDIPQLILQHRFEEAEKLLLWYKNLFKDDYYLEIQNHFLSEQIEINEKLREYSKKFAVKLVATNDVHYIYKEDSLLQDILMCVQMGKTLDDTNRLKFPCDEFYLKTYDEMLKALPNDEEAIDNTLEIVEKCNFNFEFNVYKVSSYIPANGQTPVEFLREMVEKAIVEKYGSETPEIRERVEKEMGLIVSMGFVEYFLTVWDYIDAARKMGISVGPGRGSGAGSIVAFLIGITDVEPLRYNLLFERFINPERVSMPDFDVDFSAERRLEVVDYVEKKYGKERTAKIITFTTMAAKASIKDVARTLRMPYSEVDKITKAMPNNYKRPDVIKKCFGFYKPKESDEDFGMTYGVPELVEMYKTSDMVKKVVDIAIKLEDTPRNSSMHACGIIIAPERADNFVPLNRNGDDITTQYEFAEIEKIGLLKMDFLALKNLDDISKAIGYVKENHGVEIDFKKIGYEDPEVFKYISTGNTKAMFQIESGGFQKFMKELQPIDIEEITVGIALYRPGPMDFIPQYIYNKQHPNEIHYDTPLLKPILDVTNGCIVYQEQVMAIVQKLAGYTLGQADNVRKMMGKKLADKMREEVKYFVYGREAKGKSPAIDGVIKRGIPEETGKKIWAQMEAFGKYAFNKSHSLAYSFITYQTAYLKRYYESEFLTAVLNNRISNAKEIKTYINYAKAEKIKVLPPDINKSEIYFSVKKKQIRIGLCALKGVGEHVCGLIVKEREENGKFKNLDDFLKRTVKFNINKRLIESMIYAGAFDCFEKKRSQLASVYEQALGKAVHDKKTSESGQLSFFESFSKDEAFQTVYPEIPEMADFEKLKKEKEVTGIYLSGHPLDNFIDRIKTYTFDSTMIEEEDQFISDAELDEEEEKQVEKTYSIENGTKVICGGIISELKKTVTKSTNQQIAMLQVEDLYGQFDVMVFSRVYEQIKHELAEDKCIEIKGKFSVKPGKSPTIVAESIEFLNTELQSSSKIQEKNETKTLYLKFELENQEVKNKTMEILNSYQGDVSVFVQSGKKIFDLKTKVSVKNGCISELTALLGKGNIKIK